MQMIQQPYGSILSRRLEGTVLERRLGLSTCKVKMVSSFCVDAGHVKVGRRADEISTRTQGMNYPSERV